MRPHTQQDGITLIITLLLMGVLLGVTTSLVNITLKQYQFSSISYDSEVAFQAANAGMECAQYHDWEGSAQTFEVGQSRSSISCFGQPSMNDMITNPANIPNGGEQRFRFTWGDPEVCSEVSVFKFNGVGAGGTPIAPRGVDVRPGEPCPNGSVCTYIEARGYNTSCESIDQSPRVVEREYTLLY
jgi:hypothetical protein